MIWECDALFTSLAKDMAAINLMHGSEDFSDFGPGKKLPAKTHIRFWPAENLYCFEFAAIF
jgi:hypothetical protein